MTWMQLNNAAGKAAVRVRTEAVDVVLSRGCTVVLILRSREQLSYETTSAEDAAADAARFADAIAGAEQ